MSRLTTWGSCFVGLRLGGRLGLGFGCFGYSDRFLGLLRAKIAPELQPELRGRIGKARQRGIRHANAGRHFLEGEADLESVIARLQTPEFVLQNDGDFFGILRAQEIGQFDAGKMRLEGDEKMVAADQALLLHLVQRLAHHGTQRGVGKLLIPNEILGHGPRVNGAAPKSITWLAYQMFHE